jgi:site-specific recombinase XerD
MSAKFNRFVINSTPVDLLVAVNKGSYVKEIASKTEVVLKSLDTRGFKKIAEEFTLSNLLVLCQTIFPSEAAGFFEHVVARVSAVESNPLSVSHVYRFLVCAGEATEYMSLSKTRIGNSGYKYPYLNDVVSLHKEQIKKELSSALGSFDNQSVWSLYKKLSPLEALEFCFSECLDKLKAYLAKCGEDFNSMRKPIEYGAFYAYAMFGILNSYDEVGDKKSHLTHNKSLFTKYPDVFLETCELVKTQQSSLVHTWKPIFGDDVWDLYEPNGNSFTLSRLDFSTIPGCMLEDTKAYIQQYIEAKDKHSNITRRMFFLRYGLNFVNDTDFTFESIFSFDVMKVKQLKFYLENLNNEDGDPISVSTQRSIIYELRSFFDFCAKMHSLRMDNPFYKVTFHNSHSFSKRTPYIPEEIVQRLSGIFAELPPHLQNLWEIMMNSGMRVGDCLALKENSLSYSEKHEGYLLSFAISKTEKSKQESGESSTHTIKANGAVVDAFNRQLALTAVIRKEANTDLLFVTKKGMTITPLKSPGAAASINALIEKHDVRLPSGELYNYSHHQCRKSVGVELITKGASAEDIAAILGHASAETTRTFYKDVELGKLAQIESSFFKEMFEAQLEPEFQASYSNEEKEALFKEVALGSRMTPEGHGICAKHVSMGPCVKRTCIGCKMLTSGPQHLPRLYTVRKEQLQYVADLAEQYVREGVDNYQEHRDYSMVVQKYEEVNSLIRKIEKFADKKGIAYDKEE